MPRVEGGFVSVLVLMLSGSAFAAGEFVIKSKDSDKATTIKDTGLAKLTYSLDLGEVMVGTIEWQGLKESRELTAVMQYETSLSLQDEGPHLDLTEWQHFRSDWFPLPKLTPTSFALKEITDRETYQFPFVARTEFLAAVKKHAGPSADRWLPIAKKCQGMLTFPCGVSVSKIRIKFMTKKNGVDEVVKELSLALPMGC